MAFISEVFWETFIIPMERTPPRLALRISRFEVEVAGEVEPSTFVMPLWAFDQFVVSEAGEEPEITGDLANFGLRRSDGLKVYVKELQKCINEFSKDKVRQ